MVLAGYSYDETRKLGLLFLPFFILNPFVAVVLMIFFLTALQGKYYMGGPGKMLMLFVVLLLCLINLTKVPDNDYYAHGLDFVHAKNMGYIEYLLSFGKEPAYFTYTYFLSVISDGNYKIWNFSTSFLSYFFYLNSIYIVCNHYKVSSNIFLLSLCIGAFLPQLFSLSIHTERQFLAASLAVNVIVRYFLYKKIEYVLCIISILTHSTILLVYLIAFAPFFSRIISRKNFVLPLLFSLALIGYQLLADTMLGLFSGVPFMEYVLLRASKNTTYELDPIGKMEILLVIVIVVMYIRQYFTKESSKSGLLAVFHNLALLISGFVIVNINQAELSNRLLFYVLFFLPFLVVQIRAIKQSTLIAGAAMAMLIIFFIYRIDNGVWKYLKASELLTSSFFYYLGFDYSHFFI